VKTLYLLDNPSGNGRLWKVFGDKNIHQKYKGDVENGVPNY
tara:strand:- start:147 stop:269 length:123 start_codon:yes stop_codon:yes gene_type:complete